MSITITPLTASDLDDIDADLPPFRISGETARLDGRLIAIGGVSHLPDGALLAFAELTDTARGRKVWLHRQALRILADLKRRRRRVIATASPEIEASERWLRRLGFVPTDAFVHDRRIWMLTPNAE